METEVTSASQAHSVAVLGLRALEWPLFFSSRFVSLPDPIQGRVGLLARKQKSIETSRGIRRFDGVNVALGFKVNPKPVGEGLTLPDLGGEKIILHAPELQPIALLNQVPMSGRPRLLGDPWFYGRQSMRTCRGC